MLVARLPSLVRGAAVGPIAVTDSRPGEEIGCATPGSAGRAAACSADTTAGRSDRRADPTGTAAAVRTGTSAAAGATRWPAAARCGAAAGVGQDVLGRDATGTDVVCGGVPAEP